MRAYIKSKLATYFDSRLADLRSQYDAISGQVKLLQGEGDRYWMYASFERHGDKATEALSARIRAAKLEGERDRVWQQIKLLRMQKCRLLGMFDSLVPAIA